MEGNAPFTVPFCPGHFSSAQATRAGNPDSFGTKFKRGRNALLHCPAKGDPPLQLEGDIFRHQLRIELGLAHFLNIEVNLVAGELGQFLFQGFNFGALFADNKSRPGSVDVDLCLIGSTLDLDLRDARAIDRKSVV